MNKIKFIKTNIYLTFAKNTIINTDPVVATCGSAAIVKKPGYIFKIVHDNKILYFTLEKKEYSSDNYWHLSELTTGASVNHNDFTTRQQAAEYITQYDYSMFNKIYTALQRNNAAWSDTLQQLNNENYKKLAC